MPKFKIYKNKTKKVQLNNKIPKASIIIKNIIDQRGDTLIVVAANGYTT